MAWCLTTPSHYLNQRWLTISVVQWHSYEGSFTRDTSPQSLTTKIRLKITHLKFTLNLTEANELNFEEVCSSASNWKSVSIRVSNGLRQIRGPFRQDGLTLISSWISNRMPNKVWDDIACPFPNFNDCTVEVWNGYVISSHILWWD